MPIAVLMQRGTVRTRKKPGRWFGNYPPDSPAEWLAEGHVTCSIRCLNGDCKRAVDVRLDTVPQDQPWSRIGPKPALHRMRSTWCGEHRAQLA
jgi:hypothetical protein